MPKLPFNKGTKLRQIFQILADLRWHCARHLPGSQAAKAIQIIRQNGYQIENKTMICDACAYRTVHRRLISLTPIADPVVRAALPAALKRRIKQVYKNVESVTGRTYPAAALEIDHRFSQVRWSEPECTNNLDMSDADILAKFQLLTRENNLLKSRRCEHCAKTGQRGTFIGINYFYEGGPQWPEDLSPDDERGCVGCFWYDPDKWRNSLNQTIRKTDDSI